LRLIENFLCALSFLLDGFLDAHARVPAIGLLIIAKPAPVCDLTTISCETLIFRTTTLNRRAAGKWLL